MSDVDIPVKKYKNKNLFHPRYFSTVSTDIKNDVVMIEAAGCGVAMGNACEKVKATAQYVCGTCQEDGLAAFIEENFGI